MINNNIKVCREELEMTQEELGYVLGVSKKTVSGWENSYDTIPFNKLIRFCNLYDYSMDFVVGFTRKNTKYEKIDTDKKRIGLKLRRLRKSLGLSQQQIANDCKIRQTTYSSYETGRFLINTLTAYSICKRYKISMDYLVGKTNNVYLDKY